MTSVNSQHVWGPLRRVPALASALLLTLVWGAVSPAFPPTAQAETFSDPGFTAEVVATLPPFLPVGVTWASDGRLFIWQRNGVIRIYKNSQLLATPLLDLSANVNTFDDRGMLGLALHPNFLANGSVYVSYVREDGGDPNDSSPKLARLSRFTADPQNPDVALAASETVLLTIPNDLHQHLHGTLRFGADGRLFMGHGDDSSSSVADVHSFVAQDLTDLRGKLLRLTEDGTAPGDNPFDDGTNSIRSKIYSYGLRNPFRFTLHPVSGEPYIGDVGWNAWEELNRGRGKNFGWPCYEGVNPQPIFQAAFPSQCAPLTPDVVTAPLLTYPLAGTPAAAGAPIVGNTTIGGPFYTATLYPEVYRGNWFITDYVAGWIRRLVFDGAGALTGTVPFATGLSGPVDLELGPDGLLYYVSIVTGEVKRIRYNGPAAVAAATPSSGLSPLTVNFSSAGSNDPNSGPLTYLWDFGDGQTSPDANPVHVYPAAGVQTFTATLTVNTSTNQHASATVKVTVGSRPPTATIQAPITGTPILPGQTIAYQGAAIDPEDGPIPSAGLKWIILLHHTDHTHTQLFTTGPTGSAVIQNHGVIGTYSYEFQLTATDTSGLTHTTSVTLPVLGDTAPPSDPTGLVAIAATGHITLTWTAAIDNGGIAGYGVERCQGVGCTSFAPIATPTNPSYTDTDLLLATTYSYRVRATDATGNLSLHYSNVASATSSATPLGLVTAYGMDEGSGTTLADASGSGHTGTLVNGPAWVAGQATYGQALSFDGLDDAVSVANPGTSNFGTADFTIEMWVKRTILGGAQRHLFSKCMVTTWVTGCKEFYFNASNQLTFGSFATGNTLSSPIADTNWHHIAVTFMDATNLLNIYVDGTLATTATKALEADGASHIVTVGNLFGNNTLSGLLDEVRLYSRALTLAEIQADMATPIAPPGPDTTPPSDVTGLTATAVSATQITLSWTAATDNVGVTGYQVERCQGTGCITFVQIAASTTTSYTDTGLTASTNYSYQLKAVDAATNVSMNYSNVASAATQASDTKSPNDVTGLTATVISATQITLSWTAATDNVGVTGYRVERCKGASCTSFAQITTSAGTTFGDTGLTSFTTYRYRAKAVDAATNVSVNYSNVVSSTTFKLLPKITGFTPTGGVAGASVVITGTNLTGATAVKIGTIPATSFTVDSDTQITLLVPSTAVSATISVVTPDGTAISTGPFLVTRISSFTPTGGVVGATVTITGTNLLLLGPIINVQFNGMNAAIIGTPTATSIKATVPAGATTGPISVVTPAGTTHSSTTFKLLPKITGFTPTGGVAGASVVITGTNLTGATAVKIGTIPATSFTVDSDTQITLLVPSTAVSATISVVTPDGTAISTGPFLVTRISSFTPTGGVVGATVTITGTNLLLLGPIINVQFNGMNAAIIGTPTATSIKATVPAGATTGPISVVTPAGTTHSSTTFKLLPKITGFTPTGGVAGASVVITGTNLTGATAVKIGTIPATSFTVDSDTQITLLVPSTAVSATISVVTPDGTAISTGPFLVTRISSFTPTGGVVGATVTITGTNLLLLGPIINVQFNGMNAAIIGTPTATSIKATVPAGATTGPISVVTPAGTTHSSTTFKLLPKITGFTPTGGVAGASVVITGTNLTGATAVKIGTIPATSFTVDSDTQITLLVPSTAVSATISVVTPDGTAISTGPFLVTRISSFTPTGGVVGATVTITGTNLLLLGPIINVQFNGMNAAIIGTPTATSIKATVPAGATTGPISVVTPAGTTHSSTTFKLLPKITGFTPTGGVAGASVVITGTNLTGATAVKIGTIPATSFTVDSDTQITLLVPSTAVSATISVVTPDGTAISTGPFLVTRISSFTPTGGVVGATVTITGTNLLLLGPIINVQFNGMNAAIIGTPTATSIKATVPAGATTGPISVVTPAGTTHSSTTFKLLPKITGFTPTGGVAGASVVITGTNLTGATAVKIGTIPATSFTVDSDTQITLLVPSTAVSATISVVTPDGTAISTGPFLVTRISSFTPTGGVVGATVTITGTNLLLLGPIINVQFNGMNAAIIGTPTATSIKATVPAGATTGPISVVTPAGTTHSSSIFTVR